jgi:hypothetical protein
MRVIKNINSGWRFIQKNVNQSEVLTESKYYQLAGSFAKPLEEMIPQETLDLIKEKTQMLEQNKEKEDEEKDETLELFEKLAQPQIKKKVKEKLKEEIQGYKESEREDLERLLESVE